MARKLKSKSETDDFILNVMKAVKHHAPGMHGPVETIYARMIELIDFNSDVVEVYERNGELARTTWVTLQGQRMVFTYDYDGKCLLLKRDNLRGDTKARFNWNEKKKITTSSLIAALQNMGVSC